MGGPTNFTTVATAAAATATKINGTAKVDKHLDRSTLNQLHTDTDNLWYKNHSKNIVR